MKKKLPAGEPVGFQIKTKDIPLSGLKIDERLDRAWLTELLAEPESPLGWRVLEDMPVSLELKREADFFQLTGQARVVAQHDCVRCLEPVDFDLELQLHVRLMQGEEELPEDLHLDADECLTDDEEIAVSYYQKDEIDLVPLLREQLFLDLPLYPRCDHALAAQTKKCVITFPDSQIGAKPIWDEKNLKTLESLRSQLLSSEKPVK